MLIFFLKQKRWHLPTRKLLWLKGTQTVPEPKQQPLSVDGAWIPLQVTFPKNARLTNVKSIFVSLAGSAIASCLQQIYICHPSIYHEKWKIKKNVRKVYIFFFTK